MNRLIVSIFLLLALLICDCRIADTGDGKEDSVATLIKRLGNRDLDVSRAAEEALVKLGGKAVPALIEEMKRHANVGGYPYFMVLGRIGSSSVGPLAKELENPSREIRRSAISALMQVGAPAKAAVPGIIKLLRDGHPHVRRDAAIALGELGDDRAIQNLAELLKGELDRQARQSAVSAIGKFGARAKEAIPFLIEAVSDPVVLDGEFFNYESFRCHAASTLATIGPASLTPLMNVLSSPKHPRVARVAAGWGLWQLGRQATSAVPELIKIVNDPDPDVREAAIGVLESIGPKARDAIPSLLVILNEPSASLRLRSAAAIHAIDRNNKAVIPALIRCLGDEDVMIRSGAAIRLGWIGPDAHVAVGDLVELLNTKIPGIVGTPQTVCGESAPKQARHFLHSERR